MLFGDRCPVAEPGTATGSPGNWWTVFAVVPDCFDHAVQGFAFYRSPQRKIDPKLRELGQLRAGFARGSRFVFSQHCKAGREVGLSVRYDTLKPGGPVDREEYEPVIPEGALEVDWKELKIGG